MPSEVIGHHPVYSIVMAYIVMAYVVMALVDAQRSDWPSPAPSVPSML